MKKHREAGFSRSQIIAGVWIAILAIAPGLFAQTPPEPGPQQAGSSKTRLSPEAEAERKQFLAYLKDSTPSTIADFLKSCADGKEVGKIKADRARGVLFSPDASETSPLAIERAVRDGALLDYYRRLVANGNGNMSPQEALKTVAVEVGDVGGVVAGGEVRAICRFTFVGAAGFDGSCVSCVDEFIAVTDDPEVKSGLAGLALT